MAYRPMSEATRQMLFTVCIAAMEQMANDVANGGAVNQGEIDEIVSHAKTLRDTKPPDKQAKERESL